MTQRIALVSGGIGGLGTAICRALAHAGHRVIAVDLGGRDERVAAFQAAVAGLDVSFAALDVTDFDAWAEQVPYLSDLHERFGMGHDHKTWLDMMLAELERSGAMRVQDGVLIDA